MPLAIFSLVNLVNALTAPAAASLHWTVGTPEDDRI